MLSRTNLLGCVRTTFQHRQFGAVRVATLQAQIQSLRLSPLTHVRLPSQQRHSNQLHQKATNTHILHKCHTSLFERCQVMTQAFRRFRATPAKAHEGGHDIPADIIPTNAAGGSQKPSEESGSWRSDLQIVRELLKYMWPADDWFVKARVVAAISLLVAGKLLNVSVPLLFKQIVDSLNAVAPEAVAGADLSVLAVAGTVLVGYGAARLGASLFQEMRNAVFGSVAQRAIRSAAREIFFHLQQLDLSFHLARQTGGLVRAIDRGTKGINQILSSVVLHIIPTTFEIAIVCGILINTYGWGYAAVTVATMTAYTAFTVITTAWRMKFRRHMNQADNAAAATATDSLLNYEAVKHFNNERYEMQHYDTSLAKYETAAIKTATSLAFLNAGQNAIFSIALTAMMWMASQGILSGTLTIGDLVMINGLVFQLSMPLNFLGTVYRETRQSLMDMDVMFKLRRIESKIKDAPDATDLVMARPTSDLTRVGSKETPFVNPGDIQFENVSFGYTDDRLLLKGVSFTIPAGRRVAFVGPSGSGKSTILRLLFRFYDPISGHIRIGGQDISCVRLESLRQHIGVVPQDTILFNQTVFYNIAYGRPGSDIQAVEEAARKASIHDVIVNRFPLRYETRVGERGLMISGGEKQRIQLARVFLKNAPIMLFDEATSALDQANETAIMDTIRAFLETSPGDSNAPSSASEPANALTSRTAVFIAHRLSTVADCDIIYVLDSGMIVEFGTHEDLLASNGLYAQMWKSQQHTDESQEHRRRRQQRRASHSEKSNTDAINQPKNGTKLP